MIRKFVSGSAQDTLTLAEKWARELRGGKIFALSGNLGSGKTMFAKGLARGLGIRKKILSPTFVVANVYPLSVGRNFYHLDLYRVKKRELEELGLAEILSKKNDIVAIEWPEKIQRLLPPKTVFVNFTHGKKPAERIIKIC